MDQYFEHLSLCFFGTEIVTVTPLIFTRKHQVHWKWTTAVFADKGFLSQTRFSLDLPAASY